MSSESDRPTDTSSSDRISTTDERASPIQEHRGAMNSVLDSFSDPSVQNYLKHTIGLFGMIGLGFGLTGFLLIEVVSQNIIGVAFAPLAFGIILLTLTFLIGPVIAGFTSIRIAEGLRADALTIYLTSAIGNFVALIPIHRNTAVSRTSRLVS